MSEHFARVKILLPTSKMREWKSGFIIVYAELSSQFQMLFHDPFCCTNAKRSDLHWQLHCSTYTYYVNPSNSHISSL